MRYIGDFKEGLTIFHAPFESGHVLEITQSEVPDELPEQTWGGVTYHSSCYFEE